MQQEMTGRERLTCMFEGKTPDRIASTFLMNEYYTNHNPGHGSPDDLMKELGADILDREYRLPYKKVYTGGVEYKDYYQDGKTYHIFETPVGTITEMYKGKWGSELPFKLECYVKELEDYKILQYVFEHTEFVEDYEWFEERDKVIGDNGILVPLVTEFRSSLEYLMEDNQIRTTYDLFNEEDIIGELLEVVKAKNIEACKVAAKSPAQILNIWEDSSTTILSPNLFEAYVLPEIKEFTDILKQEGKKLIHHACGHIKHLLPLMKREEVAAFESITPYHTGNINMTDCFQEWGDKYIVIGGIDPVFLVGCTVEELEKYLINTIESFGDYKKKFIISNSDSLPPGVSIEKLIKVIEVAKRFRF